MARLVVVWLGCILLAASIFFLGQEFERQSVKIHAVHGYVVPDASAIKIASLGFDNFISDIITVQAVSSLYIADKSDPQYWKDSVEAFKEFLKGGEYHTHGGKLDLISFSRYAYIASYLDPYDVERIESFVLLMDWVLDFPEGSGPILEYAARKNTSSWLLPYYLGLNYLVYQNDKQGALHWFREASVRPQASDIAKNLVVELVSEGDTRENILSGLSSLCGAVKDDEIKKDIDRRIDFFKKGGAIKNVDWRKIREDIEELRHEESEEEGHYHHGKRD